MDELRLEYQKLRTELLKEHHGASDARHINNVRDRTIVECYDEFIGKLSEDLSVTEVSNPFIYQKCPKCDGQGTVSKPPHIAGDVNEWVSSSTSFTCDVCNGTKIISTPK